MDYNLLKKKKKKKNTWIIIGGLSFIRCMILVSTSK